MMRRLRNSGFGLLLMATVVALAAEPARAAGLLVADGGFGGVLEIREQDVKVTINNGVAVTQVEQVFVNTENRVVEALYTFPVPKGASVSNFSMWINGKEMIGEVVEKERARQIYESYKQTRRDPGLLEQLDYKTFEMRIFPIAAGAEQRVQVSYYQQLDFDHDWATYVYPLATTTRADINQRTTGKFALSLEVKSEVPIEQLESPSHGDDFVMAKHASNYAQASLETDGGDLSRDLVIAYKTARARTGMDLIASKQPGEDGYFMLTVTAGEELAELSQGMDYVFILDVSGSMANDGKLQLSRESLMAFVGALGEEDRFEIITFNVAAETLFNQLQPAGKESFQNAREFLDTQRARGGTVLRPAVSAAYRYRDDDRTLNVVILSDGMTEQREQAELLQLIAERPAGTRVFCIGVGNEVNRPLLKQMAERSGGLSAFLSREDSFERQAQAFRRKLMRPAIRDLRLQFSGGDVYELEPRELPDLFHGAPLRVYGRYRSAGPVTVTLAGDVQGAMTKQTAELRMPASDLRNPEIERMWAWHRVERLLADERSGKSVSKDEIVQLCEGYSIVSPYASFIVLENDAEYQRWSIKRRNASRIERDRAAQVALRAELDRLRASAADSLGPGSDSSIAQNSSPSDTADAKQQLAGPSTAPQPAFDATGGSSEDSRGAGGGALDPLSGAIALGMAGAALAARRRRRIEQHSTNR